MKNLLSVLGILAIAFGLLILYSCGPSKEEIEFREKQRADSIAAANLAFDQAHPDSVKKVYCDNSHFIIGLYQVNGCEYISFVPNDRHQGEGVAVLHAGNCTNPVHAQTHNELKELLEEIKKNTKY